MEEKSSRNGESRSRKKTPSELPGMKLAECFICDKEFWRAKSHLKRAKHNLCSRECKDKLATQQNTGEENWNWKGGVTPENIAARARLGSWKKAVHQRDNYTCRICGDNGGGNLNAHHIRKFSEYPELRDNVSNGISLCEICHNKMFGVENDFVDFFENILDSGIDMSLKHIEYEEKLEKMWAEQEILLNSLYWDQEKSVPEIAIEIGMSEGGIRKRMKKLGIKSRSLTEANVLQHRRRGHVVPDKFEEAYIEGVSLKDMIEIFGVSSKTIYNWKKKLDLPNRNSSKNSIPEGFAEAYLKGDSLKSIEKEFNCSWKTLYHWRDKLGLPTRTDNE